MFFEEDKIKTILLCKKCALRLDDSPKIIPCGETICSTCSESIQINNKKFECIICLKQHEISDEGLPINQSLKSLLQIEPSEVYRSNQVQKLKELLNDIFFKMNSISFGIKHTNDHVKQYCIDLRNEVQLATEVNIQQINNFNEDLIKDIDQFERDCIQFNKSNENTRDEFIQILNELENFHSEWSQYLKRLQINDEIISGANEIAEKLSVKAEEEKIKLENSIFNGHILKFRKNSNKLNRSILGIFTTRSILTDNQMNELMRLCEFSFDKKWKLIYKATEDGFELSNFHLKCDNKPNTFIIIKSTNGNVFGGYTEQNWSGTVSGYKPDSQAFIFSFINMEKRPLKMKCNQPSHAMFTDDTYGPTFGRGADIYICSMSNIANKSYSNLGYSYIHPEYTYESNEIRSFLAGSYKFLTSEIEVFTRE